MVSLERKVEPIRILDAISPFRKDTAAVGSLTVRPAMIDVPCIGSGGEMTPSFSRLDFEDIDSPGRRGGPRPRRDFAWNRENH